MASGSAFSERIPTTDYRELAATFNPVEFDADEWVKAFKDAGMRYVVIPMSITQSR